VRNSNKLNDNSYSNEILDSSPSSELETGFYLKKYESFIRSFIESPLMNQISGAEIKRIWIKDGDYTIIEKDANLINLKFSYYEQ